MDQSAKFINSLKILFNQKKKTKLKIDDDGLCDSGNLSPGQNFTHDF